MKQVEFNKAAQSLSEALMPSSSKIAALTRLLKDNVALIVVLEARETKIGGDMQGAPGQHGQLPCVVSGISLFLPKDIGRKCLWNIWPPKQQQVPFLTICCFVFNVRPTPISMQIQSLKISSCGRFVKTAHLCLG